MRQLVPIAVVLSALLLMAGASRDNSTAGVVPHPRMWVETDAQGPTLFIDDVWVVLESPPTKWTVIEWLDVSPVTLDLAVAVFDPSDVSVLDIGSFVTLPQVGSPDTRDNHRVGERGVRIPPGGSLRVTNVGAGNGVNPRVALTGYRVQ